MGDTMESELPARISGHERLKREIVWERRQKAAEERRAQFNEYRQLGASVLQDQTQLLPVVTKRVAVPRVQLKSSTNLQGSRLSSGGRGPWETPSAGASHDEVVDVVGGLDQEPSVFTEHSTGGVAGSPLQAPSPSPFRGAPLPAESMASASPPRKKSVRHKNRKARAKPSPVKPVLRLQAPDIGKDLGSARSDVSLNVHFTTRPEELSGRTSNQPVMQRTWASVPVMTVGGPLASGRRGYEEEEIEGGMGEIEEAARKNLKEPRFRKWAASLKVQPQGGTGPMLGLPQQAINADPFPKPGSSTAVATEQSRQEEFLSRQMLSESKARKRRLVFNKNLARPPETPVPAATLSRPQFRSTSPITAEGTPHVARLLLSPDKLHISHGAKARKKKEEYLEQTHEWVEGLLEEVYRDMMGVSETQHIQQPPDVAGHEVQGAEEQVPIWQQHAAMHPSSLRYIPPTQGPLPLPKPKPQSQSTTGIVQFKPGKPPNVESSESSLSNGVNTRQVKTKFKGTKEEATPSQAAVGERSEAEEKKKKVVTIVAEVEVPVSSDSGALRASEGVPEVTQQPNTSDSVDKNTREPSKIGLSVTIESSAHENDPAVTSQNELEAGEEQDTKLELGPGSSPTSLGLEEPSLDKGSHEELGKGLTSHSRISTTADPPSRSEILASTGVIAEGTEEVPWEPSGAASLTESGSQSPTLEEVVHHHQMAGSDAVKPLFQGSMGAANPTREGPLLEELRFPGSPWQRETARLESFRGPGGYSGRALPPTVRSGRSAEGRFPPLSNPAVSNPPEKLPKATERPLSVSSSMRSGVQPWSLPTIEVGQEDGPDKLTEPAPSSADEHQHSFTATVETFPRSTIMQGHRPYDHVDLPLTRNSASMPRLRKWQKVASTKAMKVGIPKFSFSIRSPMHGKSMRHKSLLGQTSADVMASTLGEKAHPLLAEHYYMRYMAKLSGPSSETP